MVTKITTSLLALYLTGCAATTSVADKSKTIEEYLSNTARTISKGEMVYDQYVMKAALIAEIIENTTWPDGTKNDLTLCVIGDDDFKGRLQKIAKIVKQSKGKSWHVKRGIRESDTKYCDILFAGYFYTDRELRGFLNKASGYPILTIGDDKYFKRHGGMIAFNRPDNETPEKLNVEVNFQVIDRSGLKLSNDLKTFLAGM